MMDVSVTINKNNMWNIRRATLDDAAKIAEFQVAMAAESEGTELDGAMVLRGVAEGLKDEAKGLYLVACEAGGEVVGSLLITREWSDWHSTWYWWIQSVYVRPEYRRQGAYRALYAEVKKLAREAGVHCVRLYADRHNLPALSTYRSLGMEESHYLLFEEEM